MSARPLLLGLVALLGLGSVQAQDMIRNGDFSQGLSGWQGDGHPAGNSDPDAPSISGDGSASAAGLKIELKRTEWSRVMQEITVTAPLAEIEIAWQPYAGLKVSDQPQDYYRVDRQLGFPADIDTILQIELGKGAILFYDSDNHSLKHWGFFELADKSGLQDIHFPFHLQRTTTGHHYTFVLGFPPGQGKLILKKVSLIPQFERPPNP